MTREEEIKQAGIEYTISTRPMCIGGGAFSELIDELNRCKPFEEGAKWADENPKEGMISIESACKWLDSVNSDDYMDSGIFQMWNLIQDFKKAMKGQI